MLAAIGLVRLCSGHGLPPEQVRVFLGGPATWVLGATVLAHRVVAKWPVPGWESLVYIDDEDLEAQKRCTFAFRNAHPAAQKMPLKRIILKVLYNLLPFSVCTILIFFTFKNTPELHPNFWYQKWLCNTPELLKTQKFGGLDQFFGGSPCHNTRKTLGYAILCLFLAECLENLVSWLLKSREWQARGPKTSGGVSDL